MDRGSGSDGPLPRGRDFEVMAFYVQRFQECGGRPDFVGRSAGEFVQDADDAARFVTLEEARRCAGDFSDYAAVKGLPFRFNVLEVRL